LSRSQGPVIGAVTALTAPVTALAAATSCPAALRKRPIPSSRLVIKPLKLWRRQSETISASFGISL
jgi:hypothetical protein